MMPVNAGTTVIARNSELNNARITLTAIVPTNSPTAPGMRASGMNASAVVTVEPSSGIARCRVLATMADFGFEPSRSRS